MITANRQVFTRHDRTLLTLSGVMKRQLLVHVDGVALRALRRGHALRQADLAALAGIDTSYLSMLETGRRTRASLPVVDALAEALAVDKSSITIN
ncbi:helix-turn-helix domain-containing protein [Actinomadura macrotermitis]|uniref:helix-turn-helix domain-containing protein n=1 Tax=Actinomadura macrotermitis TaxID=2585200 RepID=UPI001F3416EE|nr:helix-turn-helix transcriptional regulator [Actinomadura macrotermitis]